MLKYLNAPADQKPKLAYAVLGPNQTAGEWQPMFHNKPNWLASTVLYEIDMTLQARGHNRAKLTDFEVGVHDGWRLLSFEEILIAKDKRLPDDHDIEYQHNNAWIRATCVYITTIAFRTKRPLSYWFDLLRRQEPPQQKVMRRIPCGREHFPPGTVIRRPFEDNRNEWYAVVGVEDDQLWMGGSEKPWSFDSSLLMSYQRSLDGGRTWLPCYIETECDAD